MIAKKKQIQIAKVMLKNSLSGGLVNSKLVSFVLREVISQRPQGLTKILKVYRRLVENKLKKEEILIESAQKVANQKQLEQEFTKNTGVKRINFKINPKIVFGAKITAGDWIYDATLDAKLNQLTKA
ncbi:hypothetical protein A2470_00440 [Candidatus Curtissbacteria bacterium RIFOXYC2_FULL_41_11]|uniref:Uncharacterized protein n=1 Tax=Candidatus Curtissbacteria bacterium RIFOXYA1_FULL_41_14 TaxID=1797737 RepID=A0A1F5HBB5_9BACT|nr:MAG: hypothetical protein UU19_C0067G0005 [Candidatus Curtissbacteria bacterium GW2011_GWD1_40_8]OGE01379.1 MAG: hypothetical protein A2196_04495 [Candidatus Curtissbacteria bacterium RIFOXYA1_FULL_41_14]OGE10072.1 MAG: hypothetical protein A2470_00440 [Candidatus Curtissbacteria bacterium RIFOXYC2_FULL_41_11]OGE16799.1 MAG: hypothetical protein A2495_02020 [Candidatus Curtissbacteria bacterium RIFOXYC12_FULL_41_11]